jgi:hypothetical protein
MTDSRIVFYVPKSTGASILGVMLKIVLLLLPTGILLLFLGRQENPEWLWIIATVVAGLLLMIRSDFLILPLIGVRHTFQFSTEAVVITNADGEKTVPLSELKTLTAFEVPAESGTVKHIVIEYPFGHKTDIFETWVTGPSMKDFEKLYYTLHKSNS